MNNTFVDKVQVIYFIIFKFLTSSLFNLVTDNLQVLKLGLVQIMRHLNKSRMGY